VSEARVSLVTVTFNSAATLRHFWADWPREACEWIVVDNCSTDDSVAVAESLGARVLRLSENVGFSAANNLGARMSTGDVLGFLNPDVTATRAGVERLGSIALGSSLLVAPQLVNQDGTLQENGRGAPYPARKLAHMFAPASTMNQHYVRHVRSGIEQVVWVMGAALFASRSTFENIGGWDPGFFIYYEDSDICLRALQRGVLTFVDGDVRFVHGWARETANGKSPSVWKHEFRSAARFYAKHPHCLIPMGRRSRALKMAEGVEAR
jgi:N-acetylglucosaminyl-diphospho-decaprenol L-rhamnosyltransferase